MSCFQITFATVGYDLRNAVPETLVRQHHQPASDVGTQVCENRSRAAVRWWPGASGCQAVAKRMQRKQRSQSTVTWHLGTRWWRRRRGSWRAPQRSRRRGSRRVPPASSAPLPSGRAADADAPGCLEFLSSKQTARRQPDMVVLSHPISVVLEVKHQHHHHHPLITHKTVGATPHDSRMCNKRSMTSCGRGARGARRSERRSGRGWQRRCRVWTTKTPLTPRALRLLRRCCGGCCGSKICEADSEVKLEWRGEPDLCRCKFGDVWFRRRAQWSEF